MSYFLDFCSTSDFCVAGKSCAVKESWIITKLVDAYWIEIRQQVLYSIKTQNHTYWRIILAMTLTGKTDIQVNQFIWKDDVISKCRS